MRYVPARNRGGTAREAAMQVSEFNINLTSEQPDALTNWYRNVLQLQPSDFGEWAFKVGESAYIVIDGHSETIGPAKEPQRVLINFVVDDLEPEHRRLQKAGVEFIREPAREPWGALIGTFLDPDGNYLQLIEMPRESAS
jgi:predicted enzyme related to lactoylglutathione lyase